ncbi:MAG: zinc ribbon domain-containing protein [Symbiobacteriaceae bacterium]|nr:zinc ribbon domain-containing protein [Symbiobacteriaceae bacterium]
MSVLILGMVALTFIIVFAIPAWVYRDAEERGMNPLGWALLTFFAQGFVGLIIYLVVRGQVNPIYYEAVRYEKESRIRCPHCKDVVSLSYDFCPRCGQRLREDCDNCGTPLEPYWRNCVTCGEPVNRRKTSSR